MATCLIDIFEAIPSPSPESSDRPLYAVMPVPGHTNYFVGRDNDSLACLLVSTGGDCAGRPHPPIRLESLDAQFELRCHLKKVGEPEQVGVFTVIRCRNDDAETTRYFLSVCETILRMFGNSPTRTQIAKGVNRLAAIFQKIRQSPTRSLNGLFGELYLILRSGNTVRVLTAWRADENARFDFTDGDIRLDVKATGGRSRIHTFSYEQCNPPSGTIAVVASLNVEQVAGGSSLRSIISQIESRISSNADLVLKLHETLAATLGTGLNDSLSRRFDMRLAESSLRFFYLEAIPAIHGPLPTGVSDVHFRSDLSALAPLSIEALIDRDPVFWDFLPKEVEV